MLKLILCTNWRTCRDRILSEISSDIAAGQGNRILLVPEQASHDYERRLSSTAGPTASRYGEVLTFRRLADRLFSLEGGIAVPTLDGGGRLLAMAAAVQQLRSKLKAYAAVGSRPEFLSALITAVDEFKSCCITPDDLKSAASASEGVLAQKLSELSLLLESYDSLCSQFGMDPRDRLAKLSDMLSLSDFGATHTFYIDGFSDFTSQELEILDHLLEVSPGLTISLNTDTLRSDVTGMELAGETAATLIRLADHSGTKHVLEILKDPESETPMGHLRSHLLSGSLKPVEHLNQVCSSNRFSGLRQECIYVASRIRELVQNGARYRDISLVISDSEKYKPVLRQILASYDIPAYFAGSEDILGKSVIYTIMTALEAVTGPEDPQDILRYLKSILSPLSPEECDRLQNYALLWGIRGSAWEHSFRKHPRGLKDEWTAEDQNVLADLNHMRETAIRPLSQLKKSIHQASNVLEQLQGLYEFLQAVDLSNRLAQLSDSYEIQGDSRSAQEQEQLWDILLSALEQMAALLGDAHLDADVFVRLLRLLISQYDVGTIPQTLDSVTAGDVSSMRRHEAKYVFLMGAQEGFLPAAGSSGMVLTESERADLVSLGIGLQSNLYRQLEIELAGIYAVTSSVSSFLTLTTGTGEPAHIYRRLCRLLGKNPDEITELSSLDCLANPWEAAALYLRSDSPVPDFLTEYGQQISSCADFQPGTLNQQTVRALYGSRLILSASQIEKISSCHFAYFMNYGMKIRKQEEIRVDPAEFGTFVHDVLENTAREVRDLGGFQVVSLEKTQELAEKYAIQYHEKHFAQLDDISQRQNYLFRRNMDELHAVVQELWRELSVSEFSPEGFEVGFKDGELLPLIPIPGSEMPAWIQGFVDRLDLYKKDGQTYIRIVDYKTGPKEFDYCDITNGIGLQMLIYLFALEDEGAEIYGGPLLPAGVLYYPARSPIQSFTTPEDPEQVEASRRKDRQRAGLVLNNAQVLSAMDPNENFPFLPVKSTKSKGLTGRLASPKQFAMLKKYVMHMLQRLVSTIASGDVMPNPYYRGEGHNACKYCDYGPACHKDLWGTRRDYKEINSDEFWQAVEKEETDG